MPPDGFTTDIPRGCRVRAIARRAAAAADAAGPATDTGTGAWPAAGDGSWIPGRIRVAPCVRAYGWGSPAAVSGMWDLDKPNPGTTPSRVSLIKGGTAARPRPTSSVGGAPGDHISAFAWHEGHRRDAPAWSQPGALGHRSGTEPPLEME